MTRRGGKGRSKYGNKDVIEVKDRKSPDDPVVFFVFHMFHCPCGSNWFSGAKTAKDGRECRKCKDFVVPNPEESVGLNSS